METAKTTRRTTVDTPNNNLPATVEQAGLEAPGLQAGQEIIDRWLASLDAKATTIDTYRKAIKAFLSWTAEHAITRPRREDILAYKRELESEGKSTYTIGSYLTAVRRFFSYLEAENLYPDIAKNVRGPKRPRGYAKEALTREQARRLVDSIETSEDVVGLRDLALVNLLIRTGIREIEATRADVGDIGREAGVLVLRVHGKGRDSKDDFVLMTADTYSPLADFLAARGKVSNDEPLFPSYSNRNRNGRLTTRAVRGIVENRLMRAGLKEERVSCHSLRHTCAMLALLGGADVVSVKEMLRHENINTTMVYVHSLNRVQDGAEKYVEF
jgi:site-specific recombinase XerD